MEVILLEKIRNLGNIGSKVVVKPGYARNYLVPFGKAVMATKANLEKFSKMHAELENKAQAALAEAQARAIQLAGLILTVSAKATEEGKLFGSVMPGNIMEALQQRGFNLKKKEISMPHGAIRQVGNYEVKLLLHSDITVDINLQVVAAS